MLQRHQPYTDAKHTKQYQMKETRRLPGTDECREN